MHEARIKNYITIRDLSIKTGIDASRISSIEHGRAYPTDEERHKLASILGDQIKFEDPETVAKNDAEFKSRLGASMAVFAEVKKRGFGKGKGGKGSMPCQTCGKDLWFSVASINGHVWARCSTDGCVSFMQ